MKIKFITPTLHGFLDYGAALALIVAPLLLKLDEHSLFIYWFSVSAGIGLIFYSAFTDYALSIKGVFSFRTHLILDSFAAAAFLVVALFQQSTVFGAIYCLVMGLGVVAVIAFSQTQTYEIVNTQ
jgi:hypothetical protein